MSKDGAAAAGQFTIGGDVEINRLGFGAMRITGAGVWGEPADRTEALRTLRRLPELGINFIDTADSYGPAVSEELLREALHPYGGILIATKGGLVRHGPGKYTAVGRPEYLRQCILMSLRRLGLERIDLWQLHRIDPKVPRDEQFDAICEFQREGLIRHVGLSQVNVEEILAAQRFFRVATVQNLFNLVDRSSEVVLDHCAEDGIGFIPFFTSCGPRSCETRVPRRQYLQENWCGCGSSCARMGPQPRPGHPADPGDQQGKAPRRERCRSFDGVVGRGIPRP
jgi:pyridoxine 4-dehydrogenase